MRPRPSKKRRIRFIATAVVVLALLLVCAFPILGKIRNSRPVPPPEPSHAVIQTPVNEIPGAIEMELPLDGPETTPGERISLVLQSTHGERIPILNGAIFIAKHKIRIPTSQVLFIREVESLGRLSYEIPVNGVVSVPIKDIALIKDRIANGAKPKTVTGSRIWILGDTHIYFIRPDGTIDVQEGLPE